MTELEVLRAELQELNDHINRLPTWNDYANSCQNKYDWLLKQYNELLEKENKCCMKTR